MKANFTRSLAWTVRFGASAAALFLVSCGSTSVPTATELTTMVAPSSNMSMDNQVAAHIGSFRSSNGLSGQTRHSGLDKLARMLKKLEDADLVAEASNGQEALEILAVTAVDFVVLDVEMPVLGGLETFESSHH